MVRAMSRPSSRLRDTNKSPLCTIWSSVSTSSAVTCLALPFTTTATRWAAEFQRPALASGGCDAMETPACFSLEQVAQGGFALLLGAENHVQRAQKTGLGGTAHGLALERAVQRGPA